MQFGDFVPVVPTAEQTVKIMAANKLYQDMVEQLVSLVDNSAHRTAALRKLLESKMTLIHGITHPPTT